MEKGLGFAALKKASVLSSVYGTLRKRAKLWVDVGKNGSPKLKTHQWWSKKPLSGTTETMLPTYGYLHKTPR